MKEFFKKHSKLVLVLIALTGLLIGLILWFTRPTELDHTVEDHFVEVERLLKNRREQQLDTDDTDPFGDDDRVRILLIGLDSRIGQASGHCDAIQMLEINRRTGYISLTAVPRGTYSPLPPGTGKLPSDYYVSNACALGGLEYGIDRIERILGKKADHIAIVGFSGFLGILQNLDLPTTETLQWLRHRQGYKIGEPQRARNHSTFLKQMLVKFTPKEHSSLDAPFQYLIYNLVETTLTFDEAREISKVLTGINPAESPWKISLGMQPPYDVIDIPYDPETVEDHLANTIGQVSHLLSPDDYQEISTTEISSKVLTAWENQQEDPEFVSWAFQNKIWFQLDEQASRYELQYNMTKAHIEIADIEQDEKEKILTDGILEMQYYEQDEWTEQWKNLLEDITKDRE